MSSPFSSLGVSGSLCDHLRRSGISAPTPVQERTIPLVLKGRDVIVQAQTGTGKTLAFLLPLLSGATPRNEFIRVLILTPTRELAIQIASEARKLADTVGTTVMSVYGGQDVIAQAHKLGAAPDMIIATPGRLLDHMRRGTIDLSHLSALILDEADQMLHMGFLPEVEEVIRATPDARQTMLFSATFPESVRVLSEKYMRQPEDIRIQGKRITLDDIHQLVVPTTDRQRRDALMNRIAQDRPFLAVIFCRTKIRAKKLAEYMAAEGSSVDELHGDLTQAQREAVMVRFRAAKIQLLVATDVAARGLDVEGVTHVYNYDVPQDPESYIHRIGRTGRAGQRGTAVTFVAAKDEADLREIEQAIGAVLDRIPMQVEEEREHGRETVRGMRSSSVQGSRHDQPGKRWQGRGASERAPVERLSRKEGAQTRQAKEREAGSGRGRSGRSEMVPERKREGGYADKAAGNHSNRNERQADRTRRAEPRFESAAGQRKGRENGIGGGKGRANASYSGGTGESRSGGRGRDSVKPAAGKGAGKSSHSRNDSPRKAGFGQSSRPHRRGGR